MATRGGVKIKGGKWTYREGFSHLPDLLIILALCKLVETIGVKLSAGGIKFLSVIGCQLCAKGVDSYDEGTTIGFKLDVIGDGRGMERRN